MSEFSRPHPSDASKQLINLFVSVYECESTGKLMTCITVTLLTALVEFLQNFPYANGETATAALQRKSGNQA